MDHTDEQLVVSYLNGEPVALDQLVTRYLKIIYGFAYYYVGGSAEAEDIVQEVFVKVWRHLKRFDQTKKFRTWIFAIAKNTCFDHLKKKRTLSFSELTGEGEDEMNFEDTLADPAPGSDILLEGRLARESIVAAINELAPSYRAVMLLRFEADLDFPEIAETLDKPLNTVKSQYRRALALLKRKMVAGGEP
jgi:RNA polymerase sigma-70 factor (ECF subfamily)